MHHDESADILGGRLQVSPPRPPLWSDPGRMTLLIGFAAVVAVAWTRIAPHYRQWRETRYRKAMRRRHGIPDDDHRPFNVAYAAALQARKKREGKSTGVTQRPPPVITVEDEPQVPSRNFDSTTGTSTSYHNSYAATDPHQTDSSPYSGLMTDAALPSTSQHSSAVQGVRSLGLNSVGGGASRPPTGSQFMSTRALHGKHALDDEMDVAPQTLAKKSRVDGEELIDGNEEPEWHVNGNELAIHQQPGKGKRGSKRVAGLDDEDDSLWGANRHDKRARKVSIDKSASAPEYDMDEDEPGDDLEESPTLTRGKKRDQAEAGSTFGGDDSVMDDDDEQPRRQRRRRMVSKKLSQSSRGQKRLRELDSYDSDDSEAERMRRAPTRKKRGKRSDEEMTPLSNDPLCKGRRIGEEWESNGVRYKVGPNGQRLRQELVKKSRSRFPMPSDSQHPDRRANVDVYVETWLTEEEYQAAKERHELAWQDTPPSPEPQSPGDVPDSPSKAGKSLLWSSTMSSRESPAKRGTLRQSIGPSTNLRLSLLSPTPASSNRRISSVHQVPASPGSDSPKLQKSRSYSKWEKQDLEAAAMLKIREKQQQQQKQAQQQEAKASLAPASGSSLLSGTAVTAAAASAKAEKAPQSSAPSFTFAPSSTSTSSTKPTTQAPNLSVPGPTTAAAKPATPTFPFPSSSNASASSAPSTSGAPTAAQPGVAQQDTQPSNSVPNFFAKPAAAASATPASSTSVPNFFAKPAEASGSSSAAPQAPTAPKTTFSFASTPTASQTQTGGAPATNSAAKPEEKKSVPGGSLLSRIGMGPPPAAQPSSTPTFSWAAPSSTTPSASGGVTADATKAGPAAPASGSTASTTSNAAPEPPKFNFSAPPKPASTTPTANGTAGAATPAATNAASSTTPKFSFGVSNSSTQSGSATASNPFQTSTSNAGNATSAPKSAFSFGAPSAPATNAFGGNAISSNSSPFGGASGATSSTMNAPSFSAAPGTTSTNKASPFGASSTPAASTNNASPFGTVAGASTSAANPSPFGTTANGLAKPGEAPKSAFSFGNPTPATSTASKPAEAPKSAFSFGTGNAPSSGTSPFGNNATQNSTTAKPDAATSKPAFSFGASSTSTPTFGASSTPIFGSSSTPTPAFGASSTAPTFGSSTSANGAGAESKPAFSFATGASNAAGSSTTTGPGSTDNKAETKPFSFGFGAPTSNTSNNSSATPSAPSFSFGSQPSSNNTTTPAASSPFGNAQQGSGSFKFGAPSGAFGFGSSSNAGQNTQK